MLSQREIEVANLVSEGLSNKEIARKLDVSDLTIKVYLREIFKKLKLDNRTKLAVWMVKNNGGSNEA